MKKLATVVASALISNLLVVGVVQSAAIQGKIINMITTSEIEMIGNPAREHVKLGGCVVKMTTDNASAQNPNSQDGACGNQWLSVDCSNDFITSKGLQSKTFDTINLAYVTNTTVRLNFRNDWKHNNYCVITSAELK